LIKIFDIPEASHLLIESLVARNASVSTGFLELAWDQAFSDEYVQERQNAGKGTVQEFLDNISFSRWGSLTGQNYLRNHIAFNIVFGAPFFLPANFELDNTLSCQFSQTSLGLTVGYSYLPGEMNFRGEIPDMFQDIVQVKKVNTPGEIWHQPEASFNKVDPLL